MRNHISVLFYASKVKFIVDKKKKENHFLQFDNDVAACPSTLLQLISHWHGVKSMMPFHLQLHHHIKYAFKFNHFQPEIFGVFLSLVAQCNFLLTNHWGVSGVKGILSTWGENLEDLCLNSKLNQYCQLDKMCLLKVTGVAVDFVLAQRCLVFLLQSSVRTHSVSFLRWPALKFTTACFDLLLDALETKIWARWRTGWHVGLSKTAALCYSQIRL